MKYYFSNPLCIVRFWIVWLLTLVLGQGGWMLNAQTVDTIVAFRALEEAEKKFDDLAYEEMKKPLEISARAYEAYDSLHFSLVRVYELQAEVLAKEKGFGAELSILKKAIDILAKKPQRLHPRRARLLYRYALVLVDEGYIEKGLSYYENALSKSIERYGESDSLTGFCYYGIGIANFRKREYENALNYFLKAVRIESAHFGQKSERLASMYNMIAPCYSMLRQFDKAITYYEMALNYQTQLTGRFHPIVARIYGNMGITYRLMKEPEKAIEMQEKGLVIARKIREPNDLSIMRKYANLSNAYRDLKQYEKALQTNQKALALLEASSRNKHHPEYARLYMNMGICYGNLEDYEEVSEAADQSLLHLDPKLSKGELPSWHRVNGGWSIYLKAMLLKGKALRSLGEQEGNQAYLVESLRWMNAAVEDADSIRQRFQSESSKYVFIDEFRGLYEGAILSAMALFEHTQNDHYLEEALGFGEKVKNASLLDALIHAKAQKFADIPPEVLEREQKLKEQLAEVEEKLFLLEDKGNENEKKLLDQQLRLKKSHHQFIQKLEQDYPDYHDLKYNTQFASVDEIRAFLNTPQDAFVEFVMGIQNVYVFLIDQESITFHSYYLSDETEADLLKHIDALQHSLTDVSYLRDQPDEAHKQYRKEAYALYQILLEDVLEEEKYAKLTIVPDGMLGYVPFEVLLTEASTENDFRKLPYLFRSAQISYAYSATLLLEQSQGKSTKSRKLLAAFAPEYDGSYLARQDSIKAAQVFALARDGNLPLPAAKKEVKNISELWGGQAFLGDKATESTFKQQAHQFQILHLSMHTLIEDENPLYSRLLFSPDEQDDGNVYAADLYNMQLSADMAVLSACNTGYGRLLKGEGIMSLSRAFTYAGCPSVVMSLWKVPDQATAQLMMAFYEELKHGKTKDEALHLAKVRYLENVQSPQTAHPYFWAGFIHVGDAEAIEIEQNKAWVLYLIAAFLGILILGIWAWRKRQTS